MLLFTICLLMSFTFRFKIHPTFIFVCSIKYISSHYLVFIFIWPNIIYWSKKKKIHHSALYPKLSHKLSICVCEGLILSSSFHSILLMVSAPTPLVTAAGETTCPWGSSWGLHVCVALSSSFVCLYFMFLKLYFIGMGSQYVAPSGLECLASAS